MTLKSSILYLKSEISKTNLTEYSEKKIKWTWYFIYPHHVVNTEILYTIGIYKAPHLDLSYIKIEN